MIKSYVEWKGERFPIRTIDLPESWGYSSPVNVAECSLFHAYEEEYDKDNKEAVAIDDSIFYFFDDGFIESDPTDEEIIKRLEQEGI